MIIRLLTVVVAALLCGADWPQFRGPDNRAVAPAQKLPLEWDDSRNVAWKVELLGRGPSSPILVADRVIATCSSGPRQDRLHVLCFDATNGERLWHRQFWATGRTLCHPTSANAAPTPASDGQRIFAFFSSNDLICLDLAGNLQWYRGLGHDYPKAGNDIGMSSSPLVVGDTVIVQVENQGDSFAAGIDGLTGETRWRQERRKEASWSSPTVLRDSVNGRVIVVLQSPWGLTGLDAHSGELAFEHLADCDGITSPVVSGGRIFVASGGLTALNAPSTPGIKTTNLLWNESRLEPSAATPVLHQGRIYSVNRAGVLTCADADKGSKIYWRLRLKGPFWASPLAVGNRLYLVNSDGLVQVVELGEAGKVVGKSDFGEPIQGTPAVADGALYVRSDRHLWKIAKTD